VSVPAVLPLKESLRESLVEIARALEPYFPDITVHWRQRAQEERSHHFHLHATEP